MVMASMRCRICLPRTCWIWSEGSRKCYRHHQKALTGLAGAEWDILGPDGPRIVAHSAPASALTGRSALTGLRPFEHLEALTSFAPPAPRSRSRGLPPVGLARFALSVHRWTRFAHGYAVRYRGSRSARTAHRSSIEPSFATLTRTPGTTAPQTSPADSLGRCAPSLIPRAECLGVLADHLGAPRADR